jgi:hypothetical protein
MAKPAELDYYALGVSSRASQEDVESAYAKLAADPRRSKTEDASLELAENRRTDPARGMILRFSEFLEIISDF